MPVLSPLPPHELKQVFVDSGYSVIDEDQYNWVLARDNNDEPFLLPKKGRLVAVEIMSHAMHRAREERFSKALFAAVHQQVKDKPGSAALIDEEE